jgi:hypothetical protein
MNLLWVRLRIGMHAPKHNQFSDADLVTDLIMPM